MRQTINANVSGFSPLAGIRSAESFEKPSAWDSGLPRGFSPLAGIRSAESKPDQKGEPMLLKLFQSPCGD